MQVNDLIFKELIKRGYSLDGNTRVWNIADSKLWYLTPEQAQAYLDVENSEGYKSLASNAEYDLMKDFAPMLKKEFKNVDSLNMIDLGCGDGSKALYLIEQLNGKFKIRYCPIDISGYMVKKAAETLSKKKVASVIETRWNISDFENLENIIPLLVGADYKRNLFLLLGYTLGNFELHELLYAIRGSMNSGDVLVIVSGIASNKWSQWTVDSKDDRMVKLNSFFIHTPLQLGFKRENLEFGVRFKNSRVEYYYTIKENAKIEFQGKSVYFNKGDQIIVAVSYKHEKDTLMGALNLHFDEVNFSISKDKSTFIAICKRV